MNKVIIPTLIIALLSLFSINNSFARNTPCSGKKGGYLIAKMANLFVMMEVQVNQNKFVQKAGTGQQITRIMMIAMMLMTRRKNKLFHI